MAVDSVHFLGRGRVGGSRLAGQSGRVGDARLVVLFDHLPDVVVVKVRAGEYPRRVDLIGEVLTVASDTLEAMVHLQHESLTLDSQNLPNEMTPTVLQRLVLGSCNHSIEVVTMQSLMMDVKGLNLPDKQRDRRSRRSPSPSTSWGRR